jgi:hypothetical protein
MVNVKTMLIGGVGAELFGNTRIHEVGIKLITKIDYS